MREYRYGTEIDVGYPAGYRFAVRLTKDGKFQAYARDLEAQKDEVGESFVDREEVCRYAETWMEGYIRTKNIHCNRRPVKM